MDETFTCCCGAEVSVAAETCHNCATNVRSMKWCTLNRAAAAVGAEEGS